MARSKKSAGRPRKSKTPKAPREPRKQSDASRIRQLSRELEKAQHQRETGASREDEIRKQIQKMRGKCPHHRVAIDPNTRNTYCKDCLDIVGIAPSQMMTDEE